MSTLTVYFCGTGFTKFDDTNKNYWNGELISTLATNNLGREFVDWAIVNGPGTHNLQADELFVKSANYGVTAGRLLGKGWEENVHHAIQLVRGQATWQRSQLKKRELKALKVAGVPVANATREGSWPKSKKNYGERKLTPQQLQEQLIKVFRNKEAIPTCVNLIGWSRGAVSCHMMANIMLNDGILKDIPINIFAVDPVPGVSNFQPNRVTLGANVKEYVGFFARDERSWGFTAAVPHTHSSTKVHIYPMAGRHASLVGDANAKHLNNPKALSEPGLIVRHFAETCLTRWNVKMDKKLNLSDAELESFHDLIRQAEADYALLKKESCTFITKQYKGQRRVANGDQGTTFTSINGPRFQPSAGLATDLVFNESRYKEIR